MKMSNDPTSYVKMLENKCSLWMRYADKQRRRADALERALRELLTAVEEDNGCPDEDDANDEAVGWDGHGEALSLTFGHLRRARDALAQQEPDQPAQDGGRDAGCCVEPGYGEVLIKIDGLPTISVCADDVEGFGHDLNEAADGSTPQSGVTVRLQPDQSADIDDVFERTSHRPWLSRNTCHADGDGHCTWEECPQLRDSEPAKSGRHCPLDTFDRAAADQPADAGEQYCCTRTREECARLMENQAKQFSGPKRDDENHVEAAVRKETAKQLWQLVSAIRLTGGTP
jgi:hypothetical protein